MQTESKPSEKVNVCIHGHGIVCGLAAQVGENCDVMITPGTAIGPNGEVVHIAEHRFRYYLKQPSKVVQQHFPHQVDTGGRINRPVLELCEGAFDAKTMDPLKPQGPNDLPTQDLLADKILIVLIPTYEEKQYFILISPYELLKKDQTLLAQVQQLAREDAAEQPGGIFKKPKEPVHYPAEVIDAVLRPVLQLPEVVVPRFGYKKLAVISNGQPFGTDNFENPFLKVASFSAIFFEYKAILDDLVPEFCEALERLHTLFGNRLTHKGANYWGKYRKVLVRKWQFFLEEGAHLYYIQYYYDWLTDLVKAYDELRAKLSAFSGACHCDDDLPEKEQVILVKLGPVLGGRSSYTPVPFRDYFQPPMTGAAGQWNEIRFLHWRMMMMIWTFDLPFLKLDENVLLRERYIVKAQEFEDSTNYLETTNIVDKPGEVPGTVNFEDLPVKFTPGQTPDTELGRQAIPYYYPLDADSLFSLHLYWNYRAAQMRGTSHLHSYNAFKTSDSYVFKKEGRYHLDALYPQGFHLREYPWLRVEGHIGKLWDAANTAKDLAAAMQRDHVLFEVIAVSTKEINDFVNKKPTNTDRPTGLGMEHTGGLAQAQTLVLVYADANEQIELAECKKDTLPEIAAKTIVADFTIPYLVRR
ncbi:hypothetical protein LZD49_27935 [Dyadobacter sp. CY261]|uniref:hypothetical protein n=1 Tax=Dyadobacter sp. CY261 TaxID=2907203 RepID=UPI001F2181C2|nr:hypothetical protein [Dyadobacter sp. CY261]MCF0074346.1 hypothetical protein [Dyadobacter sp. CY261]